MGSIDTKKGAAGMGAIGSFLSGFTSNFQAALLLWPFLSFSLTLPILAYLYHRDGRLRFSSFAAAYLSMLYVSGLGCFTLYPLPSGDTGLGITYGIAPQLNPFAFVSDIAKDGLKAALQLLFNIVLFLPLGFIAKRLLRLGLGKTFILSLAVTTLIETAQLTGFFGLYPFAYRTFDVDDIIFNTLGGVAGWWCGRALDRFLPAVPSGPPPKTNSPGFVRRCVALWVDLLIMGFCTLLPWLIIALTWEVFTDRSFTLPGLNAAQTGDIFLIGCGLISFLAVEVIIPWLHDGSTPGGALVRMTFETAPRTGGKRALFYAARSVVLLFFLVAPPYATVILGVFYLFARKMPYDYLPASPAR